MSTTIHCSSDAGRQVPDNLPSELTARKQFVLWRYVQRADSIKPTKRPFTCQGHAASVTNPAHWSSFEYASKMLRERPGSADGLGFVFTEEDDLSGMDVDGCCLAGSDEMPSWARIITERFRDTYHEKSPSRTGLKFFFKAKLSHSGKRWPVGAGAIEIYDRARFFTITGWADAGVPRVITNHQEDVDSLIAELEELHKGASLIHHPPQCIDMIIPEGQRHNTLTSFAGTMRRRGMCLPAIEAALLEVNEHQCDPPKDPACIYQIVKSAAGWTDE